MMPHMRISCAQTILPPYPKFSSSSPASSIDPRKPTVLRFSKTHQNPPQSAIHFSSSTPKDDGFLRRRQETDEWNSIINSHVQLGCFDRAIDAYHRMDRRGVEPNLGTFTLVLNACAAMVDLKQVMFVHNDVIRCKLSSSNLLCATIANAYARCGRLDLAFQMFDKMSQRKVANRCSSLLPQSESNRGENVVPVQLVHKGSQRDVAWTTLVCNATKDRRFEMALHIFRFMMNDGVEPDEFALVSLLSAVSRLGNLRLGMEIHCYLIRNCFELNEFLVCSLVDMYAKHGMLDFANQVLAEAGLMNVPAWTAIISGHARAGESHGALKLFKKMVGSGLLPSSKTLSIIFPVISELGSPRMGTEMHGYVVRQGFESDSFLGVGLIGMYAKFGSLKHCHSVFHSLPDRRVVEWTAIVNACAKHGEGRIALQLFNDMCQAGIPPDALAFTAVLSACSRSGMVEEGLKCFNSMIGDHQIKPSEEHYACLVDLLARSGRLRDAVDIIDSTELRKDGGVWEALLCSCRVHGDANLGEYASKRLMEIEPGNTSAYILLADIYSAVGRRSEACNLREVVTWNDSEIHGAV